jgi:hypothetical protein
MAALSEFHPNILIHVPNAPLPTVDRMLVDAAIEFCYRTKALRESARFPAQVGIGSYEISPSDTDLLIDQVLYVWHNDWELLSAAPWMVNTPGALDATRPTGTPSSFYHRDDPAVADESILEIYPAPDAVGDLQVVYSMRPKVTAKTLPTFLMRWWLNLSAGAVARLKRIPGMPWTGDPTDDRAEFERGVREAAVIAETGRVGGERVMRAPAPFARFAGR